jgi:hypothetical protein
MLLNKNINLNKIYLVFLVFVIIYSTDTILFGANNSLIFQILGRLIPILISFFWLLKNIFKKLSNIHTYTYLAIISIFITIVYIGKLAEGYFYYTQIGLLIFGLYFSRKYSLNEFAEVFVNLIFLISISSLIVEGFKIYIVNLPLLTLYNTSGLEFKFLFLTNISINDIGNSFERIFGPFWEPGAFQFYLNLALFFLFFIKVQNKIIYSIIIFITIISTGSGAALIPSALIIISLLFKYKVDRKIVLSIILIIILSLVLFQYGLLDEIISKSIDTSGRSFQIRFYSIIGNIYAFINNPEQLPTVPIK